MAGSEVVSGRERQQLDVSVIEKVMSCLRMCLCRAVGGECRL